MNIIDIQDQLKNFSEKQLVSEMQSPTGSAPQFLVLSEIKRRKRVRDDFAKREAAQQPTVAQEAVASAGVPQSGIAGMAEAMAPKSTMVQKAMRSGGLMQFGAEIQRGLAEKAQNEQIEPFLDEVEQMAQTEFGIDSASFGAGMRPMPTNIRPITPSAGLPSLSPFGATKTGGKGGAMLGMNRMASLRAQSNPVAEPQVMPSPVQKYDEGGVVRAANGLPLGLRQNNPGNIRPGAGFIGETGQSGGYAEFGSEEEGLRALARLLGTYSDKHGINTLRGFTSRYAPRSDNRDSFDNYVSYLSDRLGMDPDQEFDLKSMRGDLIPAIVGFEQGREYGDRYSADQISRAITAAGTDDEAAVRNALFGVNPRDVSTIPTETVPEGPDGTEAAGIYGIKGNKAMGYALPSPLIGPEATTEDFQNQQELMNRAAETGSYIQENPESRDFGGVRGNRKRIRDGEEPYTTEDRDTMRVADSFKRVQEAIESGVIPDPSGEGGSGGRNEGPPQSPEKVVLEEEDLADPVIMKFSELSEGQKRQYSRNRSVSGVDLVIDDRELSPIADFVMGAAGVSDDEDTVEDPDAPPAEPPTAPESQEGPEKKGADDGSTPQTGLAKEIADLRAKLDKDRETDKYLALAQAGLALMSSKEPTLLGAVGEAGISGLTAFREAQDRYQEGVVDLINAKAKMQSKTRSGSEFTANQMLQRANDLRKQIAEGMGTEEDNIRNGYLADMLEQRAFAMVGAGGLGAFDVATQE